MMRKMIKMLRICVPLFLVSLFFIKLGHSQQCDSNNSVTGCTNEDSEIESKSKYLEMGNKFPDENVDFYSQNPEKYSAVIQEHSVKSPALIQETSTKSSDFTIAEASEKSSNFASEPLSDLNREGISHDKSKEPLALKTVPNPSVDELEYINKLKKLFSGELTLPENVVSPVPSAINIGMVLVNSRKNQGFEENFARLTRTEFESILKHANTETPLHFIFITDAYSSKAVGDLIAGAVGKKLTMDVIQNIYQKKIGMPPLHFSLVDYLHIKSKKPEFVHKFRNLNGTAGSDKYDQDFFYIAPLYHLAFTSLHKLIVLDCQDLDFRTDISDLNAEFAPMEAGNHVMGIGLDLSLHYKVMLWRYRAENPDTLFGLPGRFQGFNSGVVLYDLDRMRRSEIYNRYLEPKEAEALLEKYLYRATLAEQDWMTNLGFSHPGLIHILPCTFNAQTSIQYMSTDLIEVFDDYHYCDAYHNLKILHMNGCGPLPEHCGNAHSGQSKKYKEGAYFDIGVKIDWVMIEKIRTGQAQWFMLD